MWGPHGEGKGSWQGSEKGERLPLPLLPTAPDGLRVSGSWDSSTCPVSLEGMRGQEERSGAGRQSRDPEAGSPRVQGRSQASRQERADRRAGIAPRLRGSGQPGGLWALLSEPEPDWLPRASLPNSAPGGAAGMNQARVRASGPQGISKHCKQGSPSLKQAPPAKCAHPQLFLQPCPAPALTSGLLKFQVCDPRCPAWLCLRLTLTLGPACVCVWAEHGKSASPGTSPG